MIKNLRSRRRPRYGAHVCAVISALLLLFSVSILYNRLSISSKPYFYPQNNDAVFNTIPLLSDSEDITAAAVTDDKIDEFDTIEENDVIEDDDDSNETDQEDRELDATTTMNKKDEIFSSGHFYFDHLSGSIRRAFNKRSIRDWDYDGGFLNEGFMGEDMKIKAAFGSDDIPLDEGIRRKMSEVESIEDALLVKRSGKKMNPLREKWGDWFDKKGDFLRRDRMFKSNFDVLNPLSNPLLQDPDGVGVTGLSRGDKMVQKWILSEFKKVPFTAKKPLGISETSSEVKKGSESLKIDNSRNVLSEKESSTSKDSSRIRKNEDKDLDMEEVHKGNTEFSGHIYADGNRWGYYPGLDSRLSFTDFVDAFFKKGKCDMRVFMIWNSPPWMYSVRHQRGLESLLAQHRDACVLVLSETIELDFFKDSFVKDGYKVAVAMPNFDELLNDTPAHVFASVWFEWRKTKFYATHYSELVRLAALYKYGGIYLDSDIIVLKPLSALNNSVGLEDQGSSLNGALMAFRKQSPFILECLKEFYLTYDDTRLRWNGADLLSRVAKKFLNRKNISIKHPELNVQPSSVFFPISSRHITRELTAFGFSTNIENKTKMGRSLVFSTNIPLKFQQTPKSILPRILPNQYRVRNFTANSSFGYQKVGILNTNSTRKSSTRALLSSEVSNQKQYPKVGAKSTGPINSSQLIQVVEAAAKTGAEVVMDAVNKPRNVTYKGLTDLVTETDKMSEIAILEVVKKNFGDHLILGEEGGIIGDTSSDYLWCIDPLDGTTNFAHGYPSFAVSVGVLFQGNPAAAAVVEFVGGPMCWNTRTFTATAGGGAFCNGQKIHPSKTDKVEQSLLVTGFGYEHDDAWTTNIELFKEFTDISRGVRRLGAAAVDMCHVALGVAEAYWEYRLKPWDMAAGVLIVEEAGGSVTRMDGGKFCVFDRSVLVSNGAIHPKLLERIAPPTEILKSKGIDFSLWYKPENYVTDL